MLERDKGPTREYAFLLAVPIQLHVSIEEVMMKLQDSLMWFEGTGSVEIENLGIIDTYNEQPITQEQNATIE